MSKLVSCIVAALVCAASAAPAFAAENIATLRTCAAMTDDATRLRCYDTEMRRLVAAPAAPAPPVAVAAAPVPAPAAAPPAAPSLTPEEAFGFSGSVARAEIDRRDEKLKTVDKLEAEVTQVGKRAYGEFVVTLANGQVWAQKSPEPGTKVKVGDQVVIKRASLGSFLLSTADGRSTRVSRVK